MKVADEIPRSTDCGTAVRLFWHRWVLHCKPEVMDLFLHCSVDGIIMEYNKSAHKAHTKASLTILLSISVRFDSFIR